VADPGPALDDPALDEAGVLRMLLDRRLSPARLSRIGRDARWGRSAAVRLRLARHPRAPLALVRDLLPGLGGKDLLDITNRTRLHPAVRQRAETLLRERWERLTRGERCSLARSAGRGLMGTVLAERDPRVLAALLENPRLEELEALKLASDPTVPAVTLDRLARGGRWAGKMAIRSALLANPSTPTAVALRLLERLDAASLRRVVEDAKFRKVVRVAAERRWDGMRSGEDRSEVPAGIGPGGRQDR